jgi:hypothetical protein
VPASQKILCVWIAALALSACKKDEKPAKGSGESTHASQEVEGHRTGLTNAKAMVENATRCEPKSGTGEVEACQRACELNHSNSCANWAAFLESSDQKRAVQLYRRSCVGGSGIGCEAEAKLAKQAGEPNSDELYLNARRYHRVHCSQGYGRSCSQLATLFEQGLGGHADEITGQSYRARACLLGVAGDC